MENIKMAKQTINNFCHTPWGALVSYHVWWLLVAYFYWRIATAYLVASFLWKASQLLLESQFNQDMVNVVARQEYCGLYSVCHTNYRVHLTILACRFCLYHARCGAYGQHVVATLRPQLVVAISGCDSGFGRALAVRLAEDDGFIVLAGCLTTANVEELAKLKLPNLHAAPLDVTKDASVTAFVETLTALVAAGAPKRQLYALVNNAGVGTGGCVDWLTMDDYQFDMNVNYFGLIRLTKVCLPLLKEAAKAAHAVKSVTKPRVVNMTSSAGLVVAPFVSPYCGSKHAAEAFSTCLRMELMDWGIAVTTANPTFHRTPIVASVNAVVQRVWGATSPTVKAEYGEDYFKYVSEKSVAMMNENLWDPNNVVDELRSAITMHRPKTQLLVGIDAKFVLPLARHYPSWILEAMTRIKAFPFMPKLAALEDKSR